MKIDTFSVKYTLQCYGRLYAVAYYKDVAEVYGADEDFIDFVEDPGQPSEANAKKILSRYIHEPDLVELKS